MITTVTFTVGDRIYRVGNINRIGSIRRFITKKSGGRPHPHAVVVVTTGSGIITEHWRLDRCRLAD